MSLPARMVRREMAFGVVLQAAGGAAHGHEVVESVAAVDPEALRDRSQSVRGIEIAVAHGVLVGPPP